MGGGWRGHDEEEVDPHAMDSASVDDSDEDDEDGGGKMPQLKTAAESFFSDSRCDYRMLIYITEVQRLRIFTIPRLTLQGLIPAAAYCLARNGPASMVQESLAQIPLFIGLVHGCHLAKHVSEDGRVVVAYIFEAR